MEKVRTLYRLRQFKNSIMINGLALLFGIIIISIIIIFEMSIMSFMKEQVSVNVLQTFQNDAGNSMSICYQSFRLIERAAAFAIVFSLEGFLMVFVYIRMSKNTSSFSTKAPLFLGLGTLLLSASFLLVGVLLLKQGQLENLYNEFQIIRVSGMVIILLSNLIFLYQVFLQVVLEKIEE